MSEADNDQARKEYGMEELRTEIEQRQKAILWEDARRGGASIDAFLWKGAPYAKPIQRAGLLVFAGTFLLIAVALGSVAVEERSDRGWVLGLALAILFGLVAIRLARNAFLRPKQTDHKLDPSD